MIRDPLAEYRHTDPDVEAKRLEGAIAAQLKLLRVLEGQSRDSLQREDSARSRLADLQCQFAETSKRRLAAEWKLPLAWSGPGTVIGR